jgi:ribosomal protein L29
MTKASTFRDQSVAELQEAVIAISKEIYNLINEKNRTKKMDKPHLLCEKKKDTARLLTIIHEKQSLRSA